MKKLFYIIFGGFLLGYFTQIILTGQTRKFDKELSVQLQKKEEKREKTSKRGYSTIRYFDVKNDKGETYNLKVSAEIYQKYDIDNNCNLVIEKDIFGDEFYEIKEDYDERQVSISDSTNVWIGRALVAAIGIAWIGLVWYLVRTVRSMILNRKTN